MRTLALIFLLTLPLIAETRETTMEQYKPQSGERLFVEDVYDEERGKVDLKVTETVVEEKVTVLEDGRIRSETVERERIGVMPMTTSRLLFFSGYVSFDGVLIKELQEKSPFLKARSESGPAPIDVGDKIVQVNGRPVGSLATFYFYLNWESSDERGIEFQIIDFWSKETETRYVPLDAFEEK